MIVKFETKSNRVKGISFHPTRPWVLTSLHSGVIQLWDYRIGSLIDKYEEHEGPVRGISFHQSQPLFVSGGDDFKIKMWNYKLKKCIYTLTGHLDYIRTVYFHHELPWVLSSSDDQTIRIWNYQSRSLISILTGHSHYVMCAQFHPSKDLIVSCSLDQTLRLWDFTNLRKKYTSTSVRKPNETYSANDVELKCVLEGHDRGVNWCCFHPTLNIIASGADDRKVKLWKYVDSKAWEHDSLYGHGHNVSSVIFSPKMDIMISNSEDKTIRIWDLNKRLLIETYKREQERFWMLGFHPEGNLLAAGSDNGMILFNLSRDRIPYHVVNNSVYFAHKKMLKHFDLKTKEETLLKELDYQEQSIFYNIPKTLYYNTFDTGKHSILIQFDHKETGFYKYNLYKFEGEISSDRKKLKDFANKFSYCVSSVFISKGKIGRVTDKDKNVSIDDYETDHSLKSLPGGIPLVEAVFPATIGKIILKTENSLILYDVTNKKVINDFTGAEAPLLKRLVWCQNNNYVALLCKKSIVILNKSFNKICIIQEKFNVKCAIWSSETVLIYCTVNHLKYALLNGDNGILKCLEYPINLLKFEDDNLHILDKNGTISTITINREEYLFKLALYHKDPKRIKFILANHKRLGNSLISYLFKKNYSGIALNMVDIPKAKFSLAIDSGNLEVAFKTANELKDRECYMKLGEEALLQGNQQLVEIAYQNSKNFEKLSFFYLITGNLTKLEKMLYIAQNRGDIMSRFQNAIFLGDFHERVRILAETGQLPLAFMAAVTHNIKDMALPLKQSITTDFPRFEFTSTALIPPKPLIKEPELSKIVQMNWPHHSIAEEDLLQTKEEEEETKVKEIIEEKNELDIEIINQPANQTPVQEVKAALLEEEVKDNWGIDDLELPEETTEKSDPQQSAKTANKENDLSVVTLPDKIVEAVKNSNRIGDLVACGLFEAAMKALRKQIAVCNFEPFKQVFLDIYMGSTILLSSIPFSSPLEVRLVDDKKELAPLSIVTMTTVENELKSAYKLTTEGSFNEAVMKFRRILLLIPMLNIQKPKEKDDVALLIRICLEYIMGLRCELARKQTNDPVRSFELSAYMSSCNLQPSHRILALRSSMSLAFKQKNFIYSSYFAKKIIQIAEANPVSTKPDVVNNAKKVYAACENQGKNESKAEFTEEMLNDENLVFKLCANSLTLIPDAKYKVCAYDLSRYKQDCKEKVCDVCKVAEIGISAFGLKLGYDH